MGYRRLTPKERYQIEGYLQSGLSFSEIARRLKRNKSTISREVQRLSRGAYLAEEAQDQALGLVQDKAARRRKIKSKLKSIVESKLGDDWSPEQISGRLRLEGGAYQVSYQAIYRYIARDKASGGSLWKHLRILRKQRKDRTKPGWRPHPEPLKERLLIEERDPKVEKRNRLGDIERDTVFGVANGALLLTMVDRTSRLVRVEKVEKNSSELVHPATVRALENERVKTITNDNGREFTKHRQTSEALSVPIYFSRAYRSWERGTNENTNGLLRQYFPRRKDIGRYSEEYVKETERKLNNRPRKCLGYQTPLEVHRKLKTAG